MRFADIWLVIGTRPEAIKLSPVASALRKRGAEPLLLFTGQHPALDPGEFGLDGFHSHNLGCPGQLNPYDHARAVEERMRAELAHPPALLIVQGDTSSAYGAARAAFVHGTPVAHVEAGLRTHDACAPWPEEEFRCAIDARAELLFAPTSLNAANLAGERNSGMREKTERPEAIACGAARIVGVDRERIVAETLRLLDHPLELADMARPRFPFGEGSSGEQIAAIVCGWLDGRKGQAFGEA